MFFEKLRDNFYRVVIPLNLESLKSVNVYVVKGEKNGLIVDTGMGDNEIFLKILHILSHVGIEPEETKVVVTHFHIDHIGFAKKMLQTGCELLLSITDWEKAKKIRSASLKEEAFSFLWMCGCPLNRENFSFFDEVDQVYEIEETDHISFLSEGDIIEVGQYKFISILTPGHTPGHVTLYEPTTQIYISGDHLLNEISPTVQARAIHDDPLRDYLASLNRVSRLPINLVLPSHGEPFFNAKRRIEELFLHHEKRLKEIIRLLKKKQRTIYELASLMEWDIHKFDFHGLPIRHKIFAMGEALAHANFLKKEGKIEYNFDIDGRVYLRSIESKETFF
ncbi:MAG: MBL fold metallo-hydrolase [Deltaproteobacteria bacterium]|nr:MBL fold metallo-hydrolase [Deltaproteobacteria bacterium]